MLEVLRIRRFALLWWAGLISNIGNWLMSAALPVFVYQQTNSTLATGLMFVAQGLPFLAFSSLAGVFVDRWDRARIMIAANLAQALVMLLLLLVRSDDGVWIVYVVAFLQVAAALFFGPAENALLPTLVDRDKLTTANALNSLNDTIPRLIGPPVGGLLLVQMGISSIAVINSVTFLISAGMISLLASSTRGRTTHQVPKAEAWVQNAWSSFWADWLEGLRVVGRVPLAGMVFVAIGLSSIGDGSSSLLLVTFNTDVLDGTAQHYGWILTARGVGGLIGGLVVGRLASRWLPVPLLALGLIATGLGLAAMALLPSLGVTLILMALIGIAVTAWASSARTILQSSVDDRYLGRVFASYGATLELLALIGLGIVSAVGETTGPALLMIASGGLYILGGIAARLLGRTSSATT